MFCLVFKCIAYLCQLIQQLTGFIITLCAFNCVKESGKTPAYLAVGIAAGLLWDCEGDEAGAEVSACAKTEGVAAALAKYSQITDEQDVALIKRFYDMLSAKAPFAELIAALNEYAE